MKGLFFILIILFAILQFPGVNAQTFTWNVQNPVMLGNPGDFLSNHSYLINNSTSPVDVRVIILEDSLPPDWSGFYCPPYGCLTFAVDTSDVFTLAVSNYDSLLIDFVTGTTPATARATFKVENVNNPAEFYVTTFRASTGPSDIRIIPGVVSGKFRLEQNYPNPFNPSTTIPFEIGGNSIQTVQLTVYNVLGQAIRTLVDREMHPGSYQVTWDGKNNIYQTVPTGIYFYQLRIQEVSLVGKMIFME